MVNIPLRTKDTICAAVAAIKLFDCGWVYHVWPGTGTPNESSFQDFLATCSPELCANPIHIITKVDSPEAYDQSLRIIEAFRTVLDCTASAAIVSVLLNDLRADLKAHIPINDLQFIHSYSLSSQYALSSWLSFLKRSEPSWSTVLPAMNQQDIQDNMPPGIAEHVDFFDHPFRPPFAWKQKTLTVMESFWQGTKIFYLRRAGRWTAPDDAQIAALLLFMALLTESVTVWIRDGTEPCMKQKTFRNAAIYSGHTETSHYYRASLQAVRKISLLYEGAMSLIGANDVTAKPIFTACQRILELTRKRFDAYLNCMSNSFSRKHFMSSPKEFDDMLLWTRAFKDASPVTHSFPHASRMRNLYEKLAISKSNDFLETGIWAPDFPITNLPPPPPHGEAIPQIQKGLVPKTLRRTTHSRRAHLVPTAFAVTPKL